MSTSDLTLLTFVLGVGLKPGRIQLHKLVTDRDWQAAIISQVSGGPWASPPSEWALSSWKLEYDGAYLGRVENKTDFSKFDGEVSLSEEIVLVDLDETDLNNDAVKKIEYGERYWSLLKRQCMYHRKAPSMTFPYNEVNSRLL